VDRKRGAKAGSCSRECAGGVQQWISSSSAMHGHVWCVFLDFILQYKTSILSPAQMNVHMLTAVGQGRCENQGNIFEMKVKSSILVISRGKKCRLLQLCMSEMQ
jgi:hypothetical protein